MFTSSSVNLQQFIVNTQSPIICSHINKLSDRPVQNLMHAKEDIIVKNKQLKNQDTKTTKYIHHKNKHSNYQLNFQYLEPWTQNDFQIVQYQKQKQNKQQKSQSKLNMTFRTSQNQRCNNNCRTNHQLLQQHGFRQAKDCKQRICSSRSRTVGQQQNKPNFNTISTSYQEKLKWSIQMGLMMKRQKKISNFLKLKHFGLNFKTVDRKKSQLNCKDKTQMQTIQLIQNNSCKVNHEAHKKETQQQFFHRKYTTHQNKINQVTESNLYFSLKEYNHRQNLRQKANKILQQRQIYPQSCRTSHQSSIIKVLSFNSDLQQSIQYNNSPILGKNCFSPSKKPYMKLSKIQINEARDQSSDNNDNHHKQRSQSLSLTKNSYKGQSIRNKLKLLKSKKQSLQNNPGNKTQREYVKSITDFSFHDKKKQRMTTLIK